MNNTAGLPKNERLCSRRSMDALFSEGKKGFVYPLRYWWLANVQTDRQYPIEVLFSVPKKYFKRAWKRNLIKRRMKECYRLSKRPLHDFAIQNGKHIDLALICMADEIPDSKTLGNAVKKILAKIIESD